MTTVKKDAISGIFDQGLIRLSNPSIGFLLIKLTSKENFGLYGIGFAAILLCVGVANALITTHGRAADLMDLLADASAIILTNRVALLIRANNHQISSD
jgi:hypothetical protein